MNKVRGGGARIKININDFRIEINDDFLSLVINYYQFPSIGIDFINR